VGRPAALEIDLSGEGLNLDRCEIGSKKVLFDEERVWNRGAIFTKGMRK